MKIPKKIISVLMGLSIGLNVILTPTTLLLEKHKQGLATQVEEKRQIIRKQSSDIHEKNQEIQEKDNLIKENKTTIKDQTDLLLEKDQEIETLKNKLKEEQKKVSVSRGYTTRGVRTATSISNNERDLLYRLVEAEAGIEPYEGKVAVANVVLNRVKDPRFPNSIKGVIYQANQFEVVPKGMLWDRSPKEETKRAVDQALSGYNNIGNCIGFWATYLSKDHYLWDLPIDKQIGGHVFTSAF